MKLTVDGIEFGYGSKAVLDDVGFEVGESEIVGILGPNGSGKTTLIRCINRILTPHQGKIFLDGDDVSCMSRLDVARNLGYVPQNATNESSSPNVFEVVLMGRRPHITWEFGENDREIAWSAMDEMGVKGLATQDFSRLSSGQAQRVLIARAIAQEARIFLLDEPTSNLDVRYQLEVMDVITRLVRERGVGACVIVHDLDLAMRYCDKVILMDGGKVIAAGMTEDVLTSENIKCVYGVDAVIDHSYGRSRVVIL